MRIALLVLLLLVSAQATLAQTLEPKPLFTPLPQSALPKLLRSRPLIIDARMPNERVGEFARYQLNCKGKCSAIKLIPYDVDFGVVGELGSFHCKPGQKVLIICLAGVRSAYVANYLITSGRCKPNQVTSLEDGLMEKYRREHSLPAKQLVRK